MAGISIAISLVCAGAAFGQFADDPGLFPELRRRPDESVRLKEMLSKQQAESDKKEHQALLKRGDDALSLSDQLEKSFETTNQLSDDDKRKLETLEKLVTKIRNELGGDDDTGGDGPKLKENKPSTLKEAFGYLRSTTITLVNELKKTSRFSISAVAIQTSNTVIRLTRLMRIRN